MQKFFFQFFILIVFQEIFFHIKLILMAFQSFFSSNLIKYFELLLCFSPFKGSATHNLIYGKNLKHKCYKILRFDTQCFLKQINIIIYIN